MTTDVVDRFVAPDGWPLAGLLRAPGAPAGGVVLVPGSTHERDSFATTAEALGERGLASLRIDVRGRGGSRGEVPFSAMAPGQRRQVRLDVAAALGRLVEHAGVDSGRLAVVCEQDTAADAVLGALDAGVRGVVAMSAQQVGRAVAALERQPVPIHGVVSSDDRDAVRGTVDLYLAGAVTDSRLDVLHDLGRGATMFHLRAGQPDAPPLESLIADWLAARLA
ncbi:MAG: hypothetical protein JF603_15455 [Acidobacteria bacterium]|nr:hypothetical protein [Acidobacteriota bacterium]